MQPYVYPKPDSHINVYINEQWYMSSYASKIDAIIEGLNSLDSSYVKNFFYLQTQRALLVTMEYRIYQDSAE